MWERNRKAAPRALMLYLLGAPALVLAAVSFLPLIESNVWWIRYLDFPRVQFLLALVLVLVLLLAAKAWRRRSGLALVALAIAASGYHAYRLYPYMPVFPALAVPTASCSGGTPLRVMSFNVKKGNRSDEAVLDLIAGAEPDVLLLMETDAWWDERLTPLDETLPNHVQSIPDQAGFYGLHLFSRYPLVDPEIRFLFGADTPTVTTRIRLPDGDEMAFAGVHPRPPLFWSQPTTMRDAHLLEVALRAAEAERPVVVAGDLNAVAWERILRRAMRIGAFLDPRVGRGLYPTYDAQGRIKSWPLDHVLFQASFGLVSFRTLAAAGSDHRPVVADLCLDSELRDRQSAPPMAEDDLAEARASLSAAAEMQSE